MLSLCLDWKKQPPYLHAPVFLKIQHFICSFIHTDFFLKCFSEASFQFLICRQGKSFVVRRHSVCFYLLWLMSKHAVLFRFDRFSSRNAVALNVTIHNFYMYTHTLKTDTPRTQILLPKSSPIWWDQSKLIITLPKEKTFSKLLIRHHIWKDRIVSQLVFVWTEMLNEAAQRQKKTDKKDNIYICVGKAWTFVWLDTIHWHVFSIYSVFIRLFISL